MIVDETFLAGKYVRNKKSYIQVISSSKQFAENNRT